MATPGDPQGGGASAGGGGSMPETCYFLETTPKYHLQKVVLLTYVIEGGALELELNPQGWGGGGVTQYIRFDPNQVCPSPLTQPLSSCKPFVVPS